MSLQSSRLTRWLLRGGLATVLAAVVGCGGGQPAPTGAAALAAPRAGTARIWIYREYEPYQSVARPYVRINGAVTAISEAPGAFYRDLPPGHYDVTVDSDGTDVNQFAHLDLAAGQEVYLKVQVDPFWASAGSTPDFKRDTFYARPQMPQLAQAEIAGLPFYGGR